MAENITLGTVSTFTNDSSAVSTVNNNSALIEAAFNNVLDRYGASPNQMQNTFDMNGNQIINLPAPATVNSPARLIDVVSNPTISVPPQNPKLLNTLIASNSPFLTDTTSFTSAYQDYVLYFDHIVPASLDVFKMLVYSGGVYQTSGYVNTGSSVTTYLVFSEAVSSANSGVNGTMTWFFPSDATTICITSSTTVSDDAGNLGAIASQYGAWYTAAAVTGFKLLTVGGANITSGTIKVYGYN